LCLNFWRESKLLNFLNNVNWFWKVVSLHTMRISEFNKENDNERKWFLHS
jgi:hypothetical protein